jgi:hypothetical protein
LLFLGTNNNMYFVGWKKEFTNRGNKNKQCESYVMKKWLVSVKVYGASLTYYEWK